MPGGLIQLVAYGAQDVYLTGDPQISFFKAKYSRYTNFACESIRQDIMGTVGSGQTISFTLSRSGDLVSGLFMQTKFQRGPSNPGDPQAYYSGEQLFDHVDVYIGGQKVMEFDHEWFRMYWELYYDFTLAQAYVNMANWGNEQEGYFRTLYMPIPLWFNNLDYGRALPLIALQYHDVEIKIRLCNIENIPGINPNFTPEVSCYAKYIFLDTQERTWFASNPHEYLIQQVQMNRFPLIVDENQREFNYSLNFNHPTKALIWCTTPGLAYHGQYTAEPEEQDSEILSVMESGVLLMNGQERFSRRLGAYFGNEDPWGSFQTFTSSGIYTYGFGIACGKPEPSGTCNFSRIDNATLRFRTKAAVVANPNVPGVVTDQMTVTTSNILNTVLVFAPNYNILRIVSGMGGLAYAN